jgi:hypothetical protein
VTSLQDSLEALSKDPTVAPFLDARFPLSQKDLMARNATADLLAQLRAAGERTQMVTAEGQDAPVAVGAASSSMGGTYELYVKAGRGPTAAKADVLELDKRLAALETAIGLGFSSQLPAVFPDLSSGIFRLARKIEALDVNTRIQKIIFTASVASYGCSQ